MYTMFNYDETIRKHHVFNPEVYIEDPDKRAGVALYLEGLGYDITAASIGYGEHKWLSYERISLNDIISVNKWGGIGIGCCETRLLDEGNESYRKRVIDTLNENAIKNRHVEIDGREIDLNPISCEDNVELFKALTLYRDDTDYGKLIYYKDVPEGWHGKYRLWTNSQWDNFEKDCKVDWVKERCILLNTLEEILEHKDLIK